MGDEKNREKMNKDKDREKKDKDRDKADKHREKMPQIKREVPADESHSSNIKSLIKKDSKPSYEKRPLEKFRQKSKVDPSKTSNDKSKKPMSTSDVIKQMMEASKIGEKVSAPTFKIPKKAAPASIKRQREENGPKIGTHKRFREDAGVKAEPLSPPLSPQLSTNSSSPSPPGSPVSGSAFSPPDMYKDLSPLPLPDSPPASPPELEEGEIEDTSSTMNGWNDIDLTTEIKPLSLDNINSQDVSNSKDSDVRVQNLEMETPNLDEVTNGDEDDSLFLDSPNSLKKFFCQICDQFDNEGGTTKTKIVFHIFKKHLRGFFHKLNLCYSSEKMVKIFSSEEYSQVIQEFGLDDGIYYPTASLGENISRWKCLRCTVSLFKNEREGLLHVATEHYGQLLVPPGWFSEGCQSFACSESGCNKEFQSWTSVLNHETLKHDAFNRYVGKVFKNDYLMKTNVPKKRHRD